MEFTKIELESLFEKGLLKKYKKNTIILNEGEICNSWIYIKSGVTRHFLITKEGKDITKNFTLENNFVFSSISSFLTQSPSVIQFQTLTECEIIIWNKSVFDDFIRTPKWRKLFLKKLEELILKKELKEISLLSDNAEQRYLNFFETKGLLFNLIPHIHIASFLSISPETLSRIRKKKS